MKRIYFLILPILFTLLSSCGEEKEKTVEDDKNRFIGGMMRVNEPEYFTTLYPHGIANAYSLRIASQIFEGLVRYNPNTLELEPSLAKSFQANADNTIFSFELKQGIHFHDNPCFPNDKGRELKASDIKYCLERLQEPSKNNLGRNYVKGQIESINITGNYKVEIRLNRPNNYFIHLLAGPYGYIFPKEAVDQYGDFIRENPVGTGPFMLAHPNDLIDGLHLTLRKNPNFHQTDSTGFQLPYLDGIEYSFIKDKQTSLRKFRNQELDAVYRLMNNDVRAIVMDTLETGRYHNFQKHQANEWSIHMLGFRPSAGSVLENPLLRKAMAYAIDPKRVYQKLYVTDSLTVPNSFWGDSLDFPSYNLDSAKTFLQRAGFKNGQGLSTLALFIYADGERNSIVAKEIQRQLQRNLRMRVVLNTMSVKDYEENLMQGKAQLFLYEWFFRSPHPADFLLGLKSSNNPYPNIFGQNSPTIDNALAAGMSASDPLTSPSFEQAKKLAMDNLSIIPLWQDHNYTLCQPKIRNFRATGLPYQTYTNICFERPKVLEQVD